MRACISGFGRMGQRHALVLGELDIELVGIHDVNPEALRDKQHQLPLQIKRFTRASQMLSDTQPDLYVIATTAPAHFKLMKVAAQAPVPYVFVEKPPFCSIKEAQYFLEESPKESHIFFNFNRRHLPISRLVMQRVCDRSLGSLISTNVIGGNIGLAMGGSHWIEIHAWLTGSRPIEAAFDRDSLIVPNPRGVDFLDSSGRATLKFDDGTHLTFGIDGRSGHGLISIFSFETGIIVSNELNGDVQVISRKSDASLPTTRYGELGTIDHYEFGIPNVIETTAQTLRSGIANQSAPGLIDAQVVTEALVAAFISGEKRGARIPISRGLPKSRHFNWA